MNNRMSTLKHLLSVRKLSARVKAPAVVSAPRKPPLLSATDNDARQRTMKRSEGARKDVDEGVDEEEEEEDEEEWIAENKCLQEGSPLRASIAAAAANKGLKRSLLSSRNSPSRPQLQLQLQPEPRPVEPITGQTYDMLILAAMSVSTFK